MALIWMGIIEYTLNINTMANNAIYGIIGAG